MAAIALNQALAQRFILCMRLHFTHAEVELRVVTERKKKKNEAEFIPRALSSGAWVKN